MTLFKGIKFRNLKGENICFSNSVTNMLLASLHINSRIWEQHCFVCKFLCSIRESSSHSSIESTLPLKSGVARFYPQFKKNDQQVKCTQLWNFNN